MALVSANQFQLTPNLSGAVGAGLQAFQAVKAGQRQEQQLGIQQSQEDSRIFDERATSVLDAAVQISNLQSNEQKLNFAKSRVADLKAKGIPTDDSDEFVALMESGRTDEANALIDSAVNAGIQTGRLKAPKTQQVSAGQSEFESLTSGLTKDQKDEAVLIKLGISPRAVSSADITIAESPILTEQIADSKAIIGQRKKFGEMTGSSRAKTIDKGVETIAKIDAGLRNIDSAVELLNKGAGVGAIEKFLPSFKAASVALDNVQKRMALDVIGSVTFGALSQGELNLAKEVALPTGLDTPQLIEHLQSRKVAQEKLRSYYNEQIQFLDQGGTVAGFLRSKEREQVSQPETQTATTKQGGVLHVDAQGNRAMVFPDGSFEEIQ